MFDLVILGTVCGLGVSGICWLLGLAFTAICHIVMKNND